MVDFILRILRRGLWNVKRNANDVKPLQIAEIRMGFVTLHMEIMEFVNLAIVQH